jgi:hypothetical protein
VTGVFEVVCPSCDDNDDLNYDEVSPELRQVRGPYATDEA